jgi:hypothetical protein
MTLRSFEETKYMTGTPNDRLAPNAPSFGLCRETARERFVPQLIYIGHLNIKIIPSGCTYSRLSILRTLHIMRMVIHGYGIVFNRLYALLGLIHP